MDGHLDLLGLGSGFERVDDGACRIGDRKAGDALDFLLRRRPVGGVELDPIASSEAPLGARDGDVDGVRDHVGEVVQLERALVGDDRARVAKRQPGRHHVLIRTRREVPQPIEAATDPLVAASRSRMMTQRAAVHARFESLLGREVAGLRLRLSVEPIVIYVRHIGDFITQNADLMVIIDR